MDVAGGALFLLAGLVELAIVVGSIVAIVLAVRALMQIAGALQRIAGALENRPPS